MKSRTKWILVLTPSPSRDPDILRNETLAAGVGALKHGGSSTDAEASAGLSEIWPRSSWAWPVQERRPKEAPSRSYST